MEGPPLCVPSVLSLLQQVLASPVVWMLVEDPDPLLDVGRVNVAVAPVLHQAGQILADLHHLATEVCALVDADLVRAGRLEREIRQNITCLFVSFKGGNPNPNPGQLFPLAPVLMLS